MNIEALLDSVPADHAVAFVICLVAMPETLELGESQAKARRALVPAR